MRSSFTQLHVLPAVLATIAFALTALPGCGGQGYVGDHCAALNSSTNVSTLPTTSPVDLATAPGVKRITKNPSGVGTLAHNADFACCVRQEVEGAAARSCAVDCDTYRDSISSAGLGAPYKDELCLGSRGGAATCTVYFSKDGGAVVGTTSFCFD